MEERLGIPSIELLRLFQLDKIHNQYKLLGQAIGADLDDSAYYDETMQAVEAFKAKHGKLRFAVGEFSNCDPIETSLR